MEDLEHDAADAEDEQQERQVRVREPVHDLFSRGQMGFVDASSH